MLSPPDGLAIDLSRTCAACGHIEPPGKPLIQAPNGDLMCEGCAVGTALMILGAGGTNRRERRRAVARQKKKGDRNRKRGRR